MGWYTVVKPCVVGHLHYASIPDQPLEVDDAVAAPLVEQGRLAPYPPAPKARPAGPVSLSIPAPTGLADHVDAVRFVTPDDVPEAAVSVDGVDQGPGQVGAAAKMPPAPRPRRPRKRN